jgi:hypothetical protein
MRDLDFSRDDENAPIAYDDSRKGFKLTDPTFILPPMQLTRREVFTFSVARKLLERRLPRVAPGGPARPWAGMRNPVGVRRLGCVFSDRSGRNARNGNYPRHIQLRQGE